MKYARAVFQFLFIATTEYFAETFKELETVAKKH